MRIVDIDLMPFEIEVKPGYLELFKVGVIEDKDSPNFGKRKEVFEGVFNKSTTGMQNIIHRVVTSKIIDNHQKLNLTQFLKNYKEELYEFSVKLDKVIGNLGIKLK